MFISDQPNLVLPDATVSHGTKSQWLLEICKQHVEKFVFDRGELSGLVNQTSELQEAANQSTWKCREEGCTAQFVYHSGRVR